MTTMWTPSLQQAAVSASAMLLLAIGLIAMLQRGQWLITLLFSSAFLSLGALQAGVLGLLRATTPDGAHPTRHAITDVRSVRPRRADVVASCSCR